MEDFNLPSPERVALLERLQEVISSVTPHFWAACQICDLGALEKLHTNRLGIFWVTITKLAKWSAIVSQIILFLCFDIS